MRIELHPAARADLHHAFDWYIGAAGKLTATRFIAEFERLKVAAQNNPQAGEPSQKHSRRLIFRHFPYSLLYRMRGDSIQILALAHQSRKPDYWVGRT